jgi:hypothetical protein
MTLGFVKLCDIEILEKLFKILEKLVKFTSLIFMV